MLESAASRLLFVTVALLAMGVFTLVLGLVLLASVDFVGTGLFFLLWARGRWLESLEKRD
jgi:hypothetical protein